MAETVRLRHRDTGEEITKPKTAVPFFVNQGFEVLDSRGRVSGSATSAATTSEKGSN